MEKKREEKKTRERNERTKTRKEGSCASAAHRASSSRRTSWLLLSDRVLRRPGILRSSVSPEQRLEVESRVLARVRVGCRSTARRKGRCL